MTVNAQSRAEAFDIAQFFAPEIIDPTKSVKKALVYSPSPDWDQDPDFNYSISKLVDHPVSCHYFAPFHSQVLPRGIPWHDFPVVSSPFYSISSTSYVPYGKSSWKDFPDNGSMQSMFHQADLVVMPAGAVKRREAAYELAYILEKFGCHDIEVVAEEGGELTKRSLSDLKQPMSAEMRFRYSYLVNFTAIAMKALRALGADEPPQKKDRNSDVEKAWFSNGLGTDALFSEKISHPLALQWLYRLKKIGKFDVSYASESDELRTQIVQSSGEFELCFDQFADHGVLLKHSDRKHTLVYDERFENSAELSAQRLTLRRMGIDHIDIGTSRRAMLQIGGLRTGDGGMFFSLNHDSTSSWQGTGKYAPLEISDALADVPLHFISMLLVDYDRKKKTISLSDKGHRFLDMLHPDCQDPDVILRWMGPDGLFKEGVEQSCDDWIMRFFSKMKTRINEI